MRKIPSFSILLIPTLFACSSPLDPNEFTSGTGGIPAENGSGGANATGGADSSSGGANTGTGGAAASGGQTSGVTDSGGSNSGGSSSGGSNTGGENTGGSATGGNEPLGTGGSTSLEKTTVWLAGDSTMANGQTPCPRGWGAEIGAFFNDLVTVRNSAVGGRSVRTWLYDVLDTKNPSGECNIRMNGANPVLQTRWTQMQSEMKAGDTLLIQFGINDGSSTCPRHVGGTAFKEAYAMMAEAAKERGVQPVFLTPVSAISCSGGTPKGTRGFLNETREVGAQLNVPVIDLHALSIALYTERGFCPLPAGHSNVSAATPGAVGAFFCNDHTHFDTPGAQGIAAVVAKALRDQGLSLGDYVVTP